VPSDMNATCHKNKMFSILVFIPYISSVLVANNEGCHFPVNHSFLFHSILQTCHAV
jgi:hypothetical protein